MSSRPAVGSHLPGSVLLLALALLVVGIPMAPSSNAAGASPAASAAATSIDMEARYEVDLFLDWDTRRLDVATRIDLINTSGHPVSRVELNTIAAKLGSMKRLKVRVDGSASIARVAGQTILVPLGRDLAVGDAAHIEVSFRARLLTTSSGRDFLFSRRGGIAHMYRFIPWLSRRIPFGRNAHGEPFLTQSSPRVRVRVDSDRKLRWATSGTRIASAGRRKTFLVHHARDFNIAASPTYRLSSGTSKDGDTRIVAYTRTIDGRRLVRLARDELARFEAKTGVPYPHRTYRIAETAGGLAMESPGLIWIPGSRSPADHPFLVSHETAHQWFYGIVGNDQSTDAFADEALADYLSRRAHLSVRPSRCPQARLDLEIRKYSSRCYFEVIYVQGALFLDGLRRDFGGGPFKKAIRDYAQDNRRGIASNRKLLQAFRKRMGNGVLKRYRQRFPSIYP